MAAAAPPALPVPQNSKLAQEPATAYSLLHNTFHRWQLRLGCPVLDAALGGGLDVAGVITEVAGEAGVGKTQLALQLMLQVQLPQSMGGLAGGAVYLHGDTSNADPALRRLHTMAEAFAARHASVGAEVERLKHQIYVMQVDSPDDLWHIVDERVPALVSTERVRLIVIDSLAGLHRGLETGLPPEAPGAQAELAIHRARHVQKLAARLKQLSTVFNVAVVVLNQVTDKPLDEAQRRSAAPWERGACATAGGGARIPALGVAWASCVNTRLMLTRTAISEAGGLSGWRRWLHVAWSPRIGERSVCFEVADRGLVGRA